ncbi:MAG: hypothetical protein V9G14_10470 [Cypionkella sp.]
MTVDPLIVGHVDASGRCRRGPALFIHTSMWPSSSIDGLLDAGPRTVPSSSDVAERGGRPVPFDLGDSVGGLIEAAFVDVGDQHPWRPPRRNAWPARSRFPCRRRP